MQNFSFVITLKIWHPNIDPTHISTALEIVPHHHSRAGDARVTPKGRPLGGVYAESFWSADPFDHGEYQSREDQVEDIFMEVIELLVPKKAFLHSLHEQGATMLLQISTHSNRNYALVFPPDLLRQCSELQIGFAHDAHPYPQIW
jgi:Domain of unknown function (DUF4279)